jgi:hypothetical protein
LWDGAGRIKLRRVHFWLHAFPIFCTTEIEMYGSFHPGLRVWQHPPIYSVNHTTGSCESSPRHYGSYHHVPVKSIFGKLSDFIFYRTGLTGFTGYFFGFPDESQKFQSPSANEKIVAI